MKTETLDISLKVEEINICAELETLNCDQNISIRSGYFYSASLSPLLLRSALNYSIDTVLELTHQSATGNCE